jgi:hypothetical protein
MSRTNWLSWLHNRSLSQKYARRRRRAPVLGGVRDWLLEDRCLLSGIMMPGSSVGSLSQVLWNGGPELGNGPLNPGQDAAPPAPDQLAPGLKTLTLTNNSASTIYPILVDANTGQYQNLYYDPMDYHTQDFRAYIGYQQNGQNFLGLPPGATVVFQVPVVFWDGANLYFATDGSSMLPDYVSSIGVTSGGINYNNPTVEITGGGGTGAAATATVSNGVITGVAITNPGTGYTSAPTITITDGGSGRGATARAFLPPNPFNYIAPESLGTTLTSQANLPTTTLSVASTTGFASSGTLQVVNSNGVLQYVT